MAGVTNKQVLEAIQRLRDDDLMEIKEQLNRFNGRIRFAEQSVASLVQWRKDHENGYCATTTKEINGLRRRSNIATALLTVSQILTAALGIVFGERPP